MHTTFPSGGNNPLALTCSWHTRFVLPCTCTPKCDIPDHAARDAAVELSEHHADRDPFDGPEGDGFDEPHGFAYEGRIGAVS
jgi:hypothetical protein